MTEQLDLFSSFQPDETPAPPPAPTPARAPATVASPSRQPSPVRRATIRPLPDNGLPKDPSGRAADLGEAVAGVWHKQHGGTRIEVPIGLVAALCFVRQKDAHGPGLKAQILAQDDRQLIAMYRQIWSAQWLHRPDLIDRARILHEWLNDAEEPDKHRTYVVRAVTKTILDRGLLELTGHADPYLRAQADVLSPTLTALRSLGAQQGLGEYHTPSPISDSIAEVLLGELTTEMFTDHLKNLKPQQHIHDPAAGSGGMLRSAAQKLRREGLDPADFRWSMVDIDPIAAACAAVNALTWGLGPRVTVACADTLANPHAVEDAMAQARAVIEHRDRVVGQAHMIAAIRRTQHLLEQTTATAA
ncbi:N-6 DNA methylase [Streptomyces sp. NPDC020719]|uniref:N-6 DNA methylase n=1 Tax=Streptomyces sp. NPDC020719 TaxID=3154896 RepID=UPI00340CDE81